MITTEKDAYDLIINEMVEKVQDKSLSEILFHQFEQLNDQDECSVFYDELDHHFVFSGRQPFCTIIYRIKQSDKKYTKDTFIETHEKLTKIFIDKYYQLKMNGLVDMNVTTNRAMMYSYQYQLHMGRSITEIFEAYKHYQKFLNPKPFTNKEYQYLLSIKEAVKKENIVHYIYLDNLFSLDTKNIFYEIKLLDNLTLPYTKKVVDYSKQEIELLMTKINELKQYHCCLELIKPLDQYTITYDNNSKQKLLLDRLYSMLNSLPISEVN